MYEQIYEYLNNYFNGSLYGFCKVHSTQHILFRLIQSWKKELDNSGLMRTILMDISKAYACLPHDLLIAKLEAYGLDKPSLNMFNDYLSFWKQRAKIGSSWSDWDNVTRGIPHGSILGSLLIYDIFIFLLIIFSYLLKNLIFRILLTITHWFIVEINSQWFWKFYSIVCKPKSESRKVSIYHSWETPAAKIFSYNRVN